MSKDYSPTDICYLCGKSFSSEEINQDHIFQQQFIIRDQPMAAGYDYGGFIYVHQRCNNKFGGKGRNVESICKKALHLLEVLHSKNSQYKERSDNPEVRILAVKSSSLPEFTDSDIAFFKFNDARDISYEEMISDSFRDNKSAINPFQIPINIALSTLAKSAAGFLVKRYNYPNDGRWRILAVPHYAQDDNFSFNDLFGHTKPLEVGINVWIKKENRHWIVVYKFHRLLIFFFYEFVIDDFFKIISDQFQNIDCLCFDSNQLIDLVGYNWCSNNYPL